MTPFSTETLYGADAGMDVETNGIFERWLYSQETCPELGTLRAFVYFET